MLTFSFIKSALYYDPQVGIFVRLLATSRSQKAGQLAIMGGNGSKYNRISLFRNTYLAHRIAWIWMTGKWPTVDVDHKDGNPKNNTWNNLRLATRSQNLANAKLRNTNTSGYRGVYFFKKTGMWVARGSENGRLIQLGSFHTKRTAIKHARAHRQRVYGEFARS